MEIWLQSGILLGVVQERFSLSCRTFVIENAQGNDLYKIEVPFSSSLCMPKEYHFRVSSDELRFEVSFEKVFF